MVAVDGPHDSSGRSGGEGIGPSPHGTVTDSQILKLISLFKGSLNGAGDRPTSTAAWDGDALGVLWHVVATNGSWRPGWLAFTRMILDQELEQWGKTGRFNTHDPSQVVGALRSDFGIDCYPARDRHGIRELTEPQRSTQKLKFAKDPTVRSRFAAGVEGILGAAGCDGVCRTGPRAAWRPWHLDAKEFWFDADREIALLQRTDKVLRTEECDWKSDSALLAERGGQLGVLRSLLAGAVGLRLAEYFASAEDDANHSYRYVHRAILPAWCAWIVNGASPAIGVAEPWRDNDAAPKVAAAVEMLAMHITSERDLVSRGGNGDLAAEFERVVVQREMAPLWQTGVMYRRSGLVVASPESIPKAVPSATRLFPRIMESSALRLLKRAAPADVALRVSEHPERKHSAQWWLDMSNEIRDASDKRLKRAVIERYVSAREVEVPPSADWVWNVGDALVGWAAVNVKAPDLVNRLNRAAEHNPAGDWDTGAYRALGLRSIGTLYNKAERPALASEMMDLGLASLVRSKVTGITAIETLEQLHLGRAGVAVRELEALLARVRPGDCPVRVAVEHARHALVSAGEAQLILLALEDEGLPADRRESVSQHRIASQEWRVMTRIIRIRAALGVLAALQAGLIRRSDLRGLGSPHLDLVMDEGALADAWCDLVSLPQLKAMHMLAVSRLGLWFAFWNRMVVPVADRTAAAFSDHGLFDGVPGSVGIPAVVEVNPDDVSGWLAGEDAGWISWTHKLSSAFGTLADRSDGRYPRWRAVEGRRCIDNKIRPSSD